MLYKSSFLLVKHLYVSDFIGTPSVRLPSLGLVWYPVQATSVGHLKIPIIGATPLQDPLFESLVIVGLTIVLRARPIFKYLDWSTGS